MGYGSDSDRLTEEKDRQGIEDVAETIGFYKHGLTCCPSFPNEGLLVNRL